MSDRSCKKLPVPLSVIFIFITLFALRNAALCEFLLDEVAPAKEALEEKAPGEPVKRSDFPPHVVTRIKAQPIPDVRGAVRITWETDPSSIEDFIVGRSRVAPNTREKALAATSIKVIPAGSPGETIDSNLPPGEYYYIVLSKEKVAAKDVEVYPDVNFTLAPVVIERAIMAAPTRAYPDQVTLIHGQVINKTQVLLTWRSTGAQNIVYSVYRCGEALNNPEAVRKAERVAVITEAKESYVDRSLTLTGTYYYAVTTKDIAGNEDMQLVPDQSYLTAGINIAFKSQVIVSGLKAEAVGDNTVRLSWVGVSSPGARYLVYRAGRPIIDAQRLALSKQLASVEPGQTAYVDQNPGAGVHYYAVLVRLEDSTVDNTLRESANYTTQGVAARPAVKKLSPEAAKTPPEREAPAVTETGDLDTVLRDTFFKERYGLAIKRLRNIVSASDNEYEKAKARLFLGRSFLELGQYRESLSYFIMSDVTKYFPKESRFWREYALSRVR